MRISVRALPRSLALFAALLGAGPVVAAGLPPEEPIPSQPVELTVYAAASLKEALQNIAPACERQVGASLFFNFGGSNDLARQILAANKADLFFSADETWMDQVAKQDLLDDSSRRTLLSNRLVVVVPDASRLTISSAASVAAAEVRRVALANPDAVPAGKYAKAWLEKAAVWAKVKDKIAPFPDVRAALAAVEAGSVDAGIVYRTDATIAKHVKVAFEVPEGEGPRISYPIAALKARPALEASRRMAACIAGREAREVFARFGFVVLEPTQ
jgi:molybdate transport system substrate-binding protein